MASISKSYTREIAFELINYVYSTIDDEVHSLFTEWEFIFDDVLARKSGKLPSTSQKLFIAFLEDQLEILSDDGFVLPHDWTPYRAMRSYLESKFTVSVSTPWTTVSKVITDLYGVDTHTIDMSLIMHRYQVWLQNERKSLIAIKDDSHACALRFVKECAWCYIPTAATHAPIDA
jgi:hypothetical protein